jgi:hypothetical protein
MASVNSGRREHLPPLAQLDELDAVAIGLVGVAQLA